MQFSTPLAERIEKLFHQSSGNDKPAAYGPEFFEAFNELKEGLNSGLIRAAEPMTEPMSRAAEPAADAGLLVLVRHGAEPWEDGDLRLPQA